MIPVGQGGHDLLAEILENLLHRLALRRALGRECVHQVSRLSVRQHRIRTLPGEIVGNPIDYLMAVSAKLFRAQGIALLGNILRVAHHP